MRQPARFQRTGSRLETKGSVEIVFRADAQNGFCRSEGMFAKLTGLLLKRTPLLTRILVALVIAANLVDLVYKYTSAVQGKEKEIIEKERLAIEKMVELLALPAFRDNWDATTSLVDLGYTLNAYDFYVIKAPGHGELHTTNVRFAKTEGIPMGAQHFASPIGPDTGFFTRQQFGNIEIVVGYLATYRTLFVWSVIRHVFYQNLAQTLLMTLVVLILIGPLLRQISLIKAGNVGALQKISAAGGDLQLITELYLQNLKLTDRRLRNQIPTAAEVVQQMGTKPGDHLTGLVLRIDLNDFVRLGAKHGVEKLNSCFYPLLDDFLELAQRFSFYEIDDEGDQRVLFHPSSDLNQSVRKALGLIRACYQITQLKSAEVETSLGEKFSFKSSLAFGELELKADAVKTKLSGPPLSVSARYMGIFKDHPEIQTQFVAVTKADQLVKSELLATQKNLDVELKGLGAEKLAIVSFAMSLPRQPEDLAVCLSGEDIYLNLSELVKRWDPVRFQALAQPLTLQKSRTILLTKDPRHLALVVELLQKAVPLEISTREISQLISVAGVLSDPQSMQKATQSFLVSYLDSGNARIRANTVEILKPIGADLKIANRYLHSLEPRLRANAIVTLAKEDLSKEVTSSLELMLTAGNGALKISGLWAVQEIFKHYSLHQETLFRTADVFRHFYQIVASMKDQVRAQEIRQGYDKYFQ